MENLGDRLAELRKDRQWRQKDVAERLHVSDATISNYECGNHYPDLTALKQLANLYGVSLDYLVGDVSSKIPVASFAGQFTQKITITELLTKMLDLPEQKREIIAEIVDALVVENYLKSRDK